ncbi:MAG: phosphate regulon transcriptional regulator PhoB [Gammaproteobacteria bacterium]
MSLSTILIVDDEYAIREMVSTALHMAQLRCLQAENTLIAHEMIFNEQPNLVLLDWMLPEMSGLEFARRLRREEATQDLPIIMLTARADETEKVMGLNAGVDDYITKPFSSKELIARIKAVLRRSNATHRNTVLKADQLELDPVSQRVSSNNTPINMGPTEYRLLEFFMSNPDRAYSRLQLLDRVWGNNVYVEDRTVDVHIRRLRKALAPFGHDHFVQTVRGTGYRFSAQ